MMFLTIVWWTVQWILRFLFMDSKVISLPTHLTYFSSHSFKFNLIVCEVSNYYLTKYTVVSLHIWHMLFNHGDLQNCICSPKIYPAGGPCINDALCLIEFIVTKNLCMKTDIYWHWVDRIFIHQLKSCYVIHFMCHWLWDDTGTSFGKRAWDYHLNML